MQHRATLSPTASFKSKFHRRLENPGVSLTFTIASRIVDRSIAAASTSKMQVRNEVM